MSGADSGETQVEVRNRATSLPEGFVRELAAARRALDLWLHPSRPAVTHRRAPIGPGAVVSTALARRLEEGLGREHDRVLGPLLDRLEAFSAMLLDEKDIPVADIREGVDLVEQYLDQLHDSHIHLLQKTGVDPEGAKEARLALAQLVTDYEHARVRWKVVRVMLHGYERHIAGYGHLLGLALVQQSLSERAWHDFEREYVRTGLPPYFTPALAKEWEVELDCVREVGRNHRARVEAYTARTDPLVAKSA
jgi:hypothetical protein